MPTITRLLVAPPSSKILSGYVALVRRTFPRNPHRAAAVLAALAAHEYGIDVEAVLRCEMTGEKLFRRGGCAPGPLPHFTLPGDGRALEAFVRAETETARDSSAREPDEIRELLRESPFVLLSSRAVLILRRVLADPSVARREKNRVLRALLESCEKSGMSPRESRDREILRRITELRAKGKTEAAAVGAVAKRMKRAEGSVRNSASRARAASGERRRPFHKRTRKS